MVGGVWVAVVVGAIDAYETFPGVLDHQGAPQVRGDLGAAGASMERVRVRRYFALAIHSDSGGGSGSFPSGSKFVVGR